MTQMTDTQPETGEDDTEERRREPRVETDFPVRIQAPTRTEATVLELSPNGMRMKVSEDLSHAVQVSVYLELPEHSEPLPALADIRWHEKRGPRDNPYWVYGLQFSQLDDGPAAAIQGFVDANREETRSEGLGDETSAPAAQ